MKIDLFLHIERIWQQGKEGNSPRSVCFQVRFRNFCPIKLASPGVDIFVRDWSIVNERVVVAEQHLFSGLHSSIAHTNYEPQRSGTKYVPFSSSHGGRYKLRKDFGGKEWVNEEADIFTSVNIFHLCFEERAKDEIKPLDLFVVVSLVLSGKPIVICALEKQRCSFELLSRGKGHLVSTLGLHIQVTKTQFREVVHTVGTNCVT